MKTHKKSFKFWWAVLALLGLAGGAFWAQGHFKAAALPLAQHHDRYQCAMHPQIIQDHPGDCPICHMHLEKMEDESPEPSVAAKGQPKILKYRNPMDPTVFSERPMKDSMGMDYLPVYEEEGDDATGGVEGKASFTLSPQRQQLIGVRTELAELRDLSLTLRLPGRVTPGGQVLAQLLEIDAGTVRLGMKARLQGPGGAELEARVLEVDSNLDSLTRSFGVVLQAGSGAAWLRSGVFCQVLIQSKLGRRLAVPEDAILDTGARQVIFVADGKGHFEPRQVTLGQAGDDWVELTQGVKAGEQVVSSANFLIDSESRFKAALKQF